jgi:predicted metal-dependent peptidase
MTRDYLEARVNRLNLNDPAVEALVTARVKLLFSKPFIGQIALRLDLVDASEWCRTAAVDGRRFYYNRQFILDLQPKEILFLVGHEVLHCVYEHLGRRGHREPKIANMAQDYLINYTLVQEEVGKMPEGGLYDPAYTDEMSWEEIYELLIENKVTVKMTLDEHLDLGGHESDEDGQGGGQGGGGQEVEVTVIGKNGPPKLSDDDLQKIKNELRAQVISTAQSLGAGKVPAGIRRLIDGLVEPKMDWRTLLDAHIRSSVKDDYTFQRLGRRSWGSGYILPGQDFQNTVKLAISIDASGSLNDEMLRDFLSEVKGIMTSFPGFEIDLWSFDTEIYNLTRFTPENIHELDTWSPGGGGGTMFEANWEFMKREGIEPARFVMFTDGLPNQGWGDANYCDTLFVIRGNQNIVAPFGLTAHYEDHLLKKAA